MAESGLSFNVQANPTLRDVQGRFASMDNFDNILHTAGVFAEAAQIALRLAQEFAPGQPGMSTAGGPGTSSGAFRAGLKVEEFGTIGFAIVSDNANLLEWLRTGTGVYAGGGPITSQSGNMMVFAEGRWPTARAAPNLRPGVYGFWSIRGMQANPWEEKAKTAILAEITPILKRGSVGAIQAHIGLGEIKDF